MPHLITQNTKLKKTSKITGMRVYNFGIPAFQDEEGKRTCPFAGACAKFCYAQKGAYVWSNVSPAFQFRYLATKCDSFVDKMTAEIVKKRVDILRVHDSGDYYSNEYIDKWMHIAKALPHVRFYSYTKSIPLFLDRDIPSNFDIIFSEGGTRDNLIDYDKHRHARIFNDYDAMDHEGYVNAMDSDLMATKWFNQSHKVGLVMH
tara:strand:- start:5211 stop:5819 length:609 start_codon:yes stop_codon:yes gene_type:complete